MNTKISGDQKNRNYNSISPLQKYNIEFHNCNNFSHKYYDWKLIKPSMEASTHIIQKKNITRFGRKIK